MMQPLWILSISIVLTWASEPQQSNLGEVTISHERRLIQDLLGRYDSLGKIARPKTNSSNPVEVQYGLRLVHLDLDEKEQVMKTSVWVRIRWYDDYLKWDPHDYGGVSHITIPSDKIWTPDIVLVNTADTKQNEQKADLQVKYMGRVFWAPQRKYTSACLIDTTEFPFDRQSCDMWFQSISNYDWNLNLSAYYKSPLDLDTYLSSYKHAQEWTIISNSTLWVDTPRDVGMILMYSRRAALRFSLTIQRRAGFKGMLLIVPCALLSFLIPLIFCFPPERPDRHTLAMSLFASLTILLFMVNEVAPPSAAFVPRLALYYCFNLVVLLLATCLSATVVNLSRRGENRVRVPKLVRVIFIKVLGKVLCFGQRLQHLGDVKRASRRVRNPNVPSRNGTRSVAMPSQIPEPFPRQSSEDQASGQDTVLNVLDQKLTTIESRLMEQKEERDALPELLNVPADVRMEWRMLSLVLDRFFFFMFLIIDIISLGMFHPRIQM